MNINDRSKLTDYLVRHNLANLATISPEGFPLVSTIYYFSDKELSFYFTTKSETGKFKNILKNSKVALVISDENEMQTVQLEGFAEVIKDPFEVSNYMGKILQSALEKGVEKSANELPVNLIKEGKHVFVKIKPKWLKWSNYRAGENFEQYQETFSN